MNEKMNLVTSPQIFGLCKPQFSQVKEAFINNFNENSDLGAAVCVYVAGELAVNLWAGYANSNKNLLWQEDTTVCVASTTKGMTALCAHILVERGQLDLNESVAKYWPEFAQCGKDNITVSQLLTHEAGLPAIREDMPESALYEWDVFIQALAQTEPWWESGTTHGYHATTFGYLVGEVIRRITGISIGQFFQEEIAGPLRLDCFIGVPEELDNKVAEVLPEPPPTEQELSLLAELFKDPMSMAGRTFLNPPRDPKNMNTRAWRAAQMPASNGHASAQGVARMYAALSLGGTLDGVKILSREILEIAIKEQVNGVDAVLTMPSRFALGFMLPQRPHPYSPNMQAFGHPGRGGSLGYADMQNEIGFGYVMNQYLGASLETPDLRAYDLSHAVYASMGISSTNE